MNSTHRVLAVEAILYYEKNITQSLIELKSHLGKYVFSNLDQSSDLLESSTEGCESPRLGARW